LSSQTQAELGFQQGVVFSLLLKYEPNTDYTRLSDIAITKFVKNAGINDSLI
jgi:hypothetical protein